MTMRKTMDELRDMWCLHLRNPFILSIPLSYDVMTAFVFCVDYLEFTSLASRGFAFALDFSFGMKTVADGVFLSFGTGPAAYLGRDREWAAYGRSVVLQDTRFALARFSQSLARELEYPPFLPLHFL